MPAPTDCVVSAETRFRPVASTLCLSQRPVSAARTRLTGFRRLSQPGERECVMVIESRTAYRMPGWRDVDTEDRGRKPPSILLLGDPLPCLSAMQDLPGVD